MPKLPSHEQTLVLIKPDALQRAIVGDIISRFEKVGFRIVAMKMVWITRGHSQKHYSVHIGKYFYQRLEDMITEAPLIAMVLEGHRAVEVVRKMVGATYGRNALPGTIRGDFSHLSGNQFTLVHASATPEEAKKEVLLWFTKKEIHSYDRDDEKHVLSPTDDDLGLSAQ